MSNEVFVFTKDNDRVHSLLVEACSHFWYILDLLCLGNVLFTLSLFLQYASAISRSKSKQNFYPAKRMTLIANFNISVAVINTFYCILGWLEHI